MQEERPLAPRCQQQTSIKQQLVNVLQELELQKWEEKGEKVEEHSRARDKEAKQSHPENQTTVRQAKKVAVVNWWKAVSGEKAQKGTNGVAPNQDLSDTQEKLRAAEQTITDMREQVCLLQASLRSAQDLLNEQKHCSLVLSADKATNTEPEKELLESIGKEQKDVAVETDPVEGTGASSSPQDSFQLTANQVLVTLKKMEDMVNRALDTAEQVKEGEQRVSRVRQRMESITQKVKEALGRTVSTERQMDRLQLDLSANPAQTALEDTSGPSSSADASGDDENCRLPVISAIPDLKENGDAGRSERGSTWWSQPKEEKTHLWQGSQVKCSDSSVFIFPHTRSRPPLLPNMPTLPEEEEDSPEEMDSSSSSPSTVSVFHFNQHHF
uniref:Uncharacterized protein n=1 Tax=Knipowitschia caucasica TaxID=637954 RepID=A0AAV2LTF2_KNICA